MSNTNLSNFTNFHQDFSNLYLEGEGTKEYIIKSCESLQLDTGPDTQRSSDSNWRADKTLLDTCFGPTINISVQFEGSYFTCILSVDLGVFCIDYQCLKNPESVLSLTW